MANILHITNGESVSLRDAGLGGEVLTWQDVLHEGPVPSGLSLEQLRPVRARFLADLSGRPESEVLSGLERRDRALASFRESDEVVLWFEHDLYDQLQLIQILDWFARQERGVTQISLIDSDRYLGPMRPEELVALYPRRAQVTESHFELASRAWRAFCSPDPSLLARLARENTPALPHLSGALKRHVEQFPSAENGLSRTQQQILEIAASGVNQVEAIFCLDRDREERVFMSDLVFKQYVQGLAAARVPLLRTLDVGTPFGARLVEVTAEGRRVLRNEADHIELNGIDRWLGGTHLQEGRVWRSKPSES